MTLQVPFSDFTQAARRVLDHREAYVSAHPSGAFVTAISEDRRTLVAAVAPIPVSEARKRLEADEFRVFDGVWSIDGELAFDHEAPLAHVGAVSYLSSDEKPGLWVDAFPEPPAAIQVIRAMYDELSENGEIEEMAFEEFVRRVNPNVVVLTHAQLQEFLSRKSTC